MCKREKVAKTFIAVFLVRKGIFEKFAKNFLIFEGTFIDHKIQEYFFTYYMTFKLISIICISLSMFEEYL